MFFTVLKLNITWGKSQNIFFMMLEERKQYLLGFNYADLHFATFLLKDNVSHNIGRQVSDGYQWMDLLNL